MTGHKKQWRRRGLKEYREIERVRPQHLPRVTTSPRGVLTTAVLAVCCSACLTSAGPRHPAAEDTFKCKDRETPLWVLQLFVFLYLLFFFFSFFFLLLFSSALCRIRAAKWKRQFLPKYPHYQKVFVREQKFLCQFLQKPLLTK